MNGKQWINFVRVYGPIPTKDNLYDENLRRHARRRGIRQIQFDHPYEEIVLPCFDVTNGLPASVILTGTAGDGKTFLCGRVWEMLGGDPDIWAGQETHCQLELSVPAISSMEPGRKITLHVLRDLSAWVPEQGAEWPPDKKELLVRFCRSIFVPDGKEAFLIAANDGQLGETFRRLLPDLDVRRAKEIIEDLLVSDQSEKEGVYLKLFNLSRGSSSQLLERALDAFLNHEGWSVCYAEAGPVDQLFGDQCPIRRNYELLKQPLMRSRLRDLIELCDQNGLHVPVRQILILLSNSILGHPNVKDHVMTADDVPKIIAANSRARASVYNNIFGGNLPASRRVNSMIFDYLDRFQVGRETSNRFDNMLIFGESHEQLKALFSRLIASDEFYGADSAFLAAKRDYTEGADENPESAAHFLELLVSKRRALFFKIADEEIEDLNLWDLTVFKYGGEYLQQVLSVLNRGSVVRRNILGRIVKGMNRIFTGMLMNSDHELFLASSASLSQARVCRFLDERISVVPRLGERVEIILDEGRPYLNVVLGNDHCCRFQLTLTRYEYLSRVAEGVLPNSFSKECFEDVMAFKSRLMRELAKRDGASPSGREIVFRVLDIDTNGAAKEERIGVLI